MGLIYRKDAPLTGRQLAALCSQCGCHMTEEDFTEALYRAYFTISCWDGTRLVGFIQTVSNGITEAWLEDILVHPDWGGYGIGKNLVTRAIAELHAEGICSVSLHLPKALQDFYESLGYEIHATGPDRK